MEHTKEEVETRLYDMLRELLRSGNQEDGVISLVYDEAKEECTVKMRVSIIDEDDYIGFDSY